MSTILLRRVPSVMCDHGVKLSEDCIRCTVEYRMKYRPAISGRLGPDVLGSCDCCGTDVPLTGHLLKQPFGRGYFCENCDELENSNLCMCEGESLTGKES